VVCATKKLGVSLTTLVQTSRREVIHSPGASALDAVSAVPVVATRSSPSGARFLPGTRTGAF
jgi:hypothetical protein